MASLRDSFPLAIPAFHGNCLDVPRGLRAGGICGPSARNRKSLVHGMAERAAKPGVTVSHSCASRLEARQSGGHGWNAVAQSEFPLFRRETHRCPIERGRPPAAFGICYLSSLSVRAPSAHQGLRQRVTIDTKTTSITSAGPSFLNSAPPLFEPREARTS